MADDDKKPETPNLDPRDPAFWEQEPLTVTRDETSSPPLSAAPPQPQEMPSVQSARPTREDLAHVTSFEKKKQLYRKALAGETKLSPAQVLQLYNNIARNRQDIPATDALILQKIDDTSPRGLRAVKIYAQILLDEKKESLDKLCILSNLCVLDAEKIGEWEKQGDDVDEIREKIIEVLAPTKTYLTGQEETIEDLRKTVHDLALKKAQEMGFKVESPEGSLKLLAEAVQESITKTIEECEKLAATQNLQPSTPPPPSGPTLH